MMEGDLVQLPRNVFTFPFPQILSITRNFLMTILSHSPF